MLPVGTVIQLVDPVNKVRLQSRLIGWEPNQCIMVEQPTRAGQAVQLPKNLSVICRGMHEGRVWGFQSTVLFMQLQPFRILFLAFPKDFEEVKLRKSERVQTKLVAWVTPRKHDYEKLRDDPSAPRGIVRNLSEGGCSFSCPFRFEVNMPVFLSFEMPNGKVAKNIMGFVRNVTREQNENVYGLQFDGRGGSLEELASYISLATKLVARKGIRS